MKKKFIICCLATVVALGLAGCTQNDGDGSGGSSSGGIVDKGEPTQQQVVEALTALSGKTWKSFTNYSETYNSYQAVRQEATLDFQLYNNDFAEIKGTVENYPNNGTTVDLSYEYTNQVYAEDGYVYDLTAFEEQYADSNTGARQEVNMYNNWETMMDIKANIESLIEVFTDPSAIYPEEYGYRDITYEVEISLAGNYLASIWTYADATANYYSDEDNQIFVELDKEHNVVNYGSYQCYYANTAEGEGGRETGIVSQFRYTIESDVDTSNRTDFTGTKLDKNDFNISGLSPIDLTSIADGEIDYATASQIVLDMNSFATGTTKAVVHEEVTSVDNVKTVLDYTATRYNNYVYESLGTETVYNPADASEPTSTEDYVVQRQALEDGILLITQYEETIDKNVVSNVMGSAVHSMDEHFNPSAALEFTIRGLMKEAINTGSTNTGFSVTTVTATGTKTGNTITITVGYRLEWLISGMGTSDHTYVMTIEDGFITKIVHDYDNNGEITYATYDMSNDPMTDYTGTLIDPDDVELPETPWYY